MGTNTTASTVGQRLRQARQAQGLTPLQLARAANVTRAWLRKVELGLEQHPASSALLRVGAVLGVPPAELLGDASVPRSPHLPNPTDSGLPTQSQVTEPQPQAADTGAPANRLEDVVTVLVDEVVNNGNLAAADLLLDPAFRLHGPVAATADARRLARALYRLRHALPDLRVSLAEVLTAQDRVVVRWRLRGTHTGRVSGVAPTGTVIVQTGIAIFRVAGQQVVESWMEASSSNDQLLGRLGFGTSARLAQFRGPREPLGP